MTHPLQADPDGQAPVAPAGNDPAVDLTCYAFAQPKDLEPARTSAPSAFSTMPDVLAGRYCIERLLGAGGMGAVYRARDLLAEQYGDPDPYVALKVLNEDFAESPDASAVLYSEFRLTRYLRHDNVLRVHGFHVDTACARAFITMELMRGLTLDRMLCERPLGLPWKELRQIALPLLDALAFAHARGVVHGDMKPSNIMLSEEGVRLFDFGLGRAEEGVLPGLPHLSRERFNAWTPGYAAPEVLEHQQLSTRADVYAVACVIYELASGKHPFRHLPSTLARDQHLEVGLKPPHHLPIHGWPALRTALAFDADTRTITAGQMRDAFTNPSSWRWCRKIRPSR